MLRCVKSIKGVKRLNEHIALYKTNPVTEPQGVTN